VVCRRFCPISHTKTCDCRYPPSPSTLYNSTVQYVSSLNLPYPTLPLLRDISAKCSILLLDIEEWIIYYLRRDNSTLQYVSFKNRIPNFTHSTPQEQTRPRKRKYSDTHSNEAMRYCNAMHQTGFIWCSVEYSRVLYSTVYCTLPYSIFRCKCSHENDMICKKNNQWRSKIMRSVR